MSIVRDEEPRKNVEREIRSALRHGLGVCADRFAITVSGACASLNGYVCSPEQRDQAERLTRAVPGISAVNNYLVIDLF